MTSILVTGGASFVGGHVVRRLAGYGHRVTTIVRHRDDVLSEQCEQAGVQLIVGDLVDPAVFAQLVVEPEVIVHAAAASVSGDGSFTPFLNDNIIATRNIVALAAATRCVQLVGLSSVSVHGTVMGGRLSDSTGYLNPSPYGLSKRISELLMLDASRSMRVSILRLPAVVGAGAVRHWLASVVSKAMHNEQIEIHHPDALFNNLVYVDDLTQFIDALVRANGPSADPVPLASADPIPVRDVVRTVVEALESRSDIVVRPVDTEPFTIDDALARTSYGYQSMSTAQAVLRYCETVSGFSDFRT